jgi:hypothetical protein
MAFKQHVYNFFDGSYLRIGQLIDRIFALEKRAVP